MTIHSDALWLRDGADMLAQGGLPSWPKTWGTAWGKELHASICTLGNKLYESWTKCSLLEAENTRLRADVEGLRATNAILTDQVEALEKRLRERT